MAGSVNRVLLVGHIGRDAERTITTGGTSIARFTLATSYKAKGKDEKTEWHRVVLFGSEGVQPYLTKGVLLYVEGRIETRSWDDKDGNKRYSTEVIAERVQLLGGGKRGEQADADLDFEDVP